LVSTPGRIIASQLYRQTDSFTKLKLQQDYISNKTLAEKAEGVCSSHESAVRAISIGHGSPVISLQGLPRTTPTSQHRRENGNTETCRSKRRRGTGSCNDTVPLLHTRALLGLGVNATALVGLDYQSANDTIGNFAGCAATDRKPAIVGPARSKRHLSATEVAPGKILFQRSLPFASARVRKNVRIVAVSDRRLPFDMRTRMAGAIANPALFLVSRYRYMCPCVPMGSCAHVPMGLDVLIGVPSEAYNTGMK
jgi:hypothetical protein